MDSKDILKDKIKEAMIEETKDIEMSQDLIDRIIPKRKKPWNDKIKGFLNREVEIPLVPIMLGVAGLFIVTIIPKEIFSQPSMQTINMGDSQIIIRDVEEVAYNEN